MVGVSLALWVPAADIVTGDDRPHPVGSDCGEQCILCRIYRAKAEQDGLSVVEAVARAGSVRLRPILMTTLTTVLGLCRWQ